MNNNTPCDKTQISASSTFMRSHTDHDRDNSKWGCKSCTGSRLSHVRATRTIFLLFLVAVVVIFGIASNKLLTEHEKKLAKEQFEAIAERGLDLALQTALRKRLGTVTLAGIAAQSFPSAEMWPFVHFLGFEKVAANVIETSNGRSMGLMPLVKPDNLEEYEAFAYNTVIASNQKYPEDCGVSSFGKGVYGIDFSLDNADKRYHETEGNATWGSPYHIFTPYLFHSMGPSILMANLHSYKLFGSVIDDVISCSNERAQVGDIDINNDDDSGDKEEILKDCGVLSDALILTGKTQDVKSGPGAIVIQPIYPEDNRTALVGFICLGGNSSQHILQRNLRNRLCPANRHAGIYIRNNSRKGHPQERKYSIIVQDSSLEEWSEISTDLLSNVRSAVEVLNDLLNYDKVESQTLQLELEVIPATDLIERTTNEFHLQASYKNIDFKYECDHKQLYNGPDYGVLDSSKKCSLLKLVVDKPRLTQVLRNLISNALKFTPEEGSVTVTAVCHTTVPEKRLMTFAMHDEAHLSAPKTGTLEVSVTDTGVGLSEKEVQKVFCDGVQFHANALQAGQGSGLGLYIAKGIVELHGGSLSVCSKGRGQGTTFTMTLPLYNIDSSKEAADDLEHNLASIANVPIESLKVLVVDDAKMNRKLLVRLLENRGHICTEAENGLIALKEVKNAMSTGSSFHSILMDYEMPGMIGPAAAKEIRRLGCDSFLVGITGNLLKKTLPISNLVAQTKYLLSQ